MPKSRKKSKYRHVVIKKKKYYVDKITWADITGGAGHSTAEDFNKIKPSTMVTQSYDCHTNNQNVGKFAKYEEGEGVICYRNVFPKE